MATLSSSASFENSSFRVVFWSILALITSISMLLSVVSTILICITTVANNNLFRNFNWEWNRSDVVVKWGLLLFLLWFTLPNRRRWKKMYYRNIPQPISRTRIFKFISCVFKRLAFELIPLSLFVFRRWKIKDTQFWSITQPLEGVEILMWENRF